MTDGELQDIRDAARAATGDRRDRIGAGISHALTLGYLKGPELARAYEAAAGAIDDDADLEEDRRVIEAATSGQWDVAGVMRTVEITCPGDGVVADMNPQVNAWHNGTFIARARTRWPVLVEEVARLREAGAAALARIASDIESDRAKCPEGEMLRLALGRKALENKPADLPRRAGAT